MDSWFTLALGDGIIATVPLGRIEEEFVTRYSAAGTHSNAAVFVRYASEGSLHCEVSAFFSPAAADLAQAFDAEPCTKPARHGLQLLAGDPACWKRLFPEFTAN